MRPARLVLAMEDALLTLTPGAGDAWDVRAASAIVAPRCLAADSRQPGRIYCGTAADGVWRSDDAGASWQRAAPLRLPNVTAVSVSPVNGGLDTGAVYAGTEPSAVFRSTTGGASWEACADLATLPSAPTWSFPPRPDTHHVRWLWADPAVSGRLFAAIEAGALIRSLDGGRTWLDRVPGGPYDTHTLVSRAGDADSLYVAAGDGYYESHDGGLTWHQPEAGLDHRYLVDIAVGQDPAGPVLVSASPGPRSAYDTRHAECYVYRRIGGGRWTVVQQGLPQPKGTTVSAMTVQREPPGAFYLANNRGVFVSEDGLAWNALPLSWREPYETQRAHALLAVGNYSSD